jgi:acetyl-CoA synthetase
MHYLTGLYALDLHRDDIYWCTADPGWVTGTSTEHRTLLHGVISIVTYSGVRRHRWYRILQDRVDVVQRPTAIRMLRPARNLHNTVPRLRFIASVGEPLNPKRSGGESLLGLPIHDNWWQTETGIMIANTPAFDIKPGSTGRPPPGVEAYVLRRRTMARFPSSHARAEGELARLGWPSMFRGYLHEEARYRKCFTDTSTTGDLAKRDADGYFWSVGRADDVIKSTSIGPLRSVP